MGMADNYGGMQYDLTPEQWAEIAPMQGTVPPTPPQPAQANLWQQLQQLGQPQQGRAQYGVDLDTAGNTRQQLRAGINPRFWQLFYGRQF